MHDKTIEESILSRLMVKLYNSKNYKTKNSAKRKIKIKPEEIYKKYNNNNADLSEYDRLNEAVKYLKDKQFVYTTPQSGTIQWIVLRDDNSEEIEKYMEENFGFISKPSEIHDTERLIEKYADLSPTAQRICKNLANKLNEKNTPKDFVQTENLLKSVSFIENNTEELYLRETSMKIFGSSKMFDGSENGQKLLNDVCNEIRTTVGKPVNREEGEQNDEILGEFHIKKEPAKIMIKGAAIIHIGGDNIDLSLFEQGLMFSAENIYKYDDFSVSAGLSDIMTVENLTSYYRVNKENIVYIYLGGFANRFQRDFLKIIYRDNPNNEYLHFGDIDAGGFFILNRLIKTTGIPFKPFKMSYAELQNPDYKDCLQSLSDNDRKRLKSLENNKVYGETVKYMLNKNVKLEQEIISYDITKKKGILNCSK